MNKKILLDNAADRQLLESGYAIIPLLNPEQITTLSQYYLNHNKEIQQEMSATAHHHDISYRKKMSDIIRHIIVPELLKYAENIEVLGGSFITKAPGTTGRLAPHQDWNITDEFRFRSFNLWIPLVDTTPDNGAIRVLPKSHLINPTYRGPGIPSICAPIEAELWNGMITLSIPAGHALLYDHRLIHASGPNNTSDHRIVAVLGILEAGAPMLIFYGNGNTINVYSCTPGFFLEKNPNEGPTGLQLVDQISGYVSVAEKNLLLQLLKNKGVNLEAGFTDSPNTLTYEPLLLKRWLSRIFRK